MLRRNFLGGVVASLAGLVGCSALKETPRAGGTKVKPVDFCQDPRGLEAPGAPLTGEPQSISIPFEKVPGSGTELPLVSLRDDQWEPRSPMVTEGRSNRLQLRLRQEIFQQGDFWMGGTTTVSICLYNWSAESMASAGIQAYGRPKLLEGIVKVMRGPASHQALSAWSEEMRTRQQLTAEEKRHLDQFLDMLLHSSDLHSAHIHRVV